MASRQSKKASKGERSSRANGKAPKSDPKHNPTTKRTSSGYSEQGLTRREAIRNNSFEGLRSKVLDKR